MLENNLAKTYALKLFKEGVPMDKAASKGLHKANRAISLRRALDGLACMAYIITGKGKLAEAVEQAGAEYLKLRKPINSDNIVEYLRVFGEAASVTGFYGKSMVLESLSKKGKVFQAIKEKDFYKIG